MISGANRVRLVVVQLTWVLWRNREDCFVRLALVREETRAGSKIQ